MQTLIEYLISEDIEVVTSKPTGGIWFQHESPLKLTALSPRSYNDVKKVRDDNYPVADRKKEENKYRKLTNSPSDISFLYCTIVGYNSMEEPDKYPGYTYYFKLSDKQLEQTVFDVVDKKIWMQPTLGQIGMDKAIGIWTKHTDQFKKYRDPNAGMIYPRVEVIIPFAVLPELVYTQAEDR